MAHIELSVNGEHRRFEGEPDTPLLWVLRDALGLKGTKYGCGVGVCGSCAVLIDGEPRHACALPVADAAGRVIVTIEGIARDPSHPVIQAWIIEQVPQCGYCQPAQVVAASWLLQRHPQPTDAQIDETMSRVLCRCGTYQRVRRAIQRAAALSAADADPLVRAEPVADLEDSGGVPSAGGKGLLDARGRFAPNPWVRISADGTVTVVIDRSEMGQGVTTGLATLVAEELEVGLDQLRIEFAPADRAYVNRHIGEQMTGGSTSVRNGWRPLREAGAQAREMLIAAAAKRWGVPRGECRAQHGEVAHAPSGRHLGFGELALDAARLRPRVTPRLRAAGDFRLIGRSLPRLELPDMVLGRAVYGLDVTRPGMLHAALLRCPAFGGKLARLDADQARRMPGVHEIVALDDAVAVVAHSVAAAVKARDALQGRWTAGEAARSSVAIHAQLAAALERRGSIARDEGNVARALGRAPRLVDALYETPYLAHATMEPMNCVADVRADGCDIWVGTQAQQAAQTCAMELTGLPRERVRVHTVYLGGGFGRRLETDFVAEAVRVSRRIGRPVQVFWTRADDMRHDFYRPASLTAFKAGLGEDGAPIAWLQRISGPALALDGVDVPYDIPNLREVHIEEDPGIPTGPWRSVGASQNAFAIECFVDELAFETRQDPVAFRRALLRHAPRHRGALELAAEKAGWGRELPALRGRGVAVYHSFGSWVAQIAEVSVEPDGALGVDRVVCAMDCGTVVNPDAVAAQIEGAIVFGLSAALHGEITIANGAVSQSSFEDYPMVVLRDAPDIEVHLVQSRRPPGGVGEPGVPPVAPAVANALFAAIGKRLRRLPLSRALRAPTAA
jgi:isoquinoline 1-oxidoreductase beta subunit